MRRNLLGAALLAPAIALGQSTTPTAGQIILDGLPTSTVSYVNLAQCTGQQNAIRQTADSLTVDLTWNLSLDPALATAFVTGGTYKLFVANQQADSTVSAFSCLSNNTTFKSAQIDLSAFTVNDQNPMLSAISPARKDLAAALATAVGQGACTTALTGVASTVYLCLQWSLNGNAAGRATTSMTLDVTPPGAPTLSTPIGAGDGRLFPTWSSVSDAATYKAFAVDAANPAVVRSSSEGQSASATIGGLTNGTTYSVTAYAFDAAENPSVASNAVDGVPEPVSSFWDVYKSRGGGETGGCGTGPAGALALLCAAAALLAARRRKS
jgi:hypothetical protein